MFIQFPELDTGSHRPDPVLSLPLVAAKLFMFQADEQMIIFSHH
jgi:hypothetical protein